MVGRREEVERREPSALPLPPSLPPTLVPGSTSLTSHPGSGGEQAREVEESCVLSVQEMRGAVPCRLCFVQPSSASSHRAVWVSVSLLTAPHPILWPRLSLVGSLVPVLLPFPLGVRGWFPRTRVDNRFVSD